MRRSFAAIGVAVAFAAVPGAAVAGGSTRWTLQSIPAPAGAQGAGLAGVSCPSTTVCTAVGQYVNSSGIGVTLAERWNGVAWSIQPTPNPAGSTDSGLSAVSCSSRDACTAVGRSANNVGESLTLAERWNGSRWSLQATPTPAGTGHGFLSGVSCPSFHVCTAVGAREAANGGFGFAMLGERWDGAQWVIQPTPDLPGTQISGLAGVSCPSVAACTAVGSANFATLADRWDGNAWLVQPTPSPDPRPCSECGIHAFSLFSGVSCPAITQCIAVGYYADHANLGHILTVAELWNGTAWSLQPTAEPTGAGQSYLFGVSCTSSNICTAVGASVPVTGSSVGTLIERKHGARWAVQPTPNLAGAVYSSLSGISCPAITACVTVGFYLSGSGAYVPLAEQY